jgi:hypothetical protein
VSSQAGVVIHYDVPTSRGEYCARLTCIGRHDDDSILSIVLGDCSFFIDRTNMMALPCGVTPLPHAIDDIEVEADVS